MSKELMKLALEALDGGHVDRAYGYIEKALAQREWVGLTDEEIEIGCSECGIGGGHALYCVRCAEKFVEALVKGEDHMNQKQIAAEIQNEERALELQGLVKEFFEKYLNRVEESDSGKMFNPVTVSCCRAMMTEPLSNLLDRMAELSGAERKNT